MEDLGTDSGGLKDIPRESQIIRRMPPYGTSHGGLCAVWESKFLSKTRK